MTITVDPVGAAQATLSLIDPRFEPEGKPAVSFAEMVRTVSEIECLDLDVDHKRDKAQRYLGWLQGVAEAVYDVPAETLRAVNRGEEMPGWPGYETDDTGWYRRKLSDGEPRRSRFAFGFTDDVWAYVLSPALDPAREPPHARVEVHVETGIYVAGGGMEPGHLEGLEGLEGLEALVRGLSRRQDPTGLQAGVAEMVERALRGEKMGPAQVEDIARRAIERDLGALGLEALVGRR